MAELRRATRVRIEDLAGWADTIPYEILCGLGRRVVRTYVEGRAANPIRPAAAASASAGPAPAAQPPSGWPPEELESDEGPVGPSDEADDESERPPEPPDVRG